MISLLWRSHSVAADILTNYIGVVFVKVSLCKLEHRLTGFGV